MKLFKSFAAALLACAALVFTSCEKGVTNTPDYTGNLYGIWQVDSKVVGDKTTDFTSEHFYLCLTPILMAFEWTGSIAALDVDHIDVDFSFYTYNDQQHKISFREGKTQAQSMEKFIRLSGTYDVLELSQDKLVISKTVGNTTTTYNYHLAKRLLPQKESESN